MDKIVNNEIDLESLPDSNSLQFIEHMYENFLANPSSLDPYWSSYFEKFSDHLTKTRDQNTQIRPTWSREDLPRNFHTYVQ